MGARVLINILIDDGRRLERERRFAARTSAAVAVPDHDPAYTPLLVAIRSLPERQRLAVVLPFRMAPVR